MRRMTREEAGQIIATWLASNKSPEVKRGYIEGWFDEEDVEAFHMAIEALSEPKTGKWIDEETDEYKRTYCSLCGSSAPFECVSDDYYGRKSHGETRKTDYCPHCGAKMIGENADNPKIGHEETTNVTMWRYECGAKMIGENSE